MDVIFALSSAWTLTESDSDFSLLEQRLSDLNPSELILVGTQLAMPAVLHSSLLGKLECTHVAKDRKVFECMHVPMNGTAP